jgi:hypothetical protein
VRENPLRSATRLMELNLSLSALFSSINRSAKSCRKGYLLEDAGTSFTNASTCRSCNRKVHQLLKSVNANTTPKIEINVIALSGRLRRATDNNRADVRCKHDF